MNILQNIIFPGYSPTVPEVLYFRQSEKVFFSRETKEIRLDRYGKCIFDTYFNGLMLEAWSGKAKLDSLFLRLRGRGRVHLKVLVSRIMMADYVALDQIIEITETGVDFALSETLQWQDGMVFFEIVALEDDVLFAGGEYYTTMQRVNAVKLGLVITHFNRKNYVLPAMQRISKEIIDNSLYQNKIALIVVDNSANITLEEAGKAHVITNQNLGGSGGFTRGLLHLMDDGSFTHCLFMDDDASCEMESIHRTYMLLQYVQEEKFAIAGAQLRESYPAEIHEKGATFHNGSYFPIYSGLYIGDKWNAIRSEIFYKKANYGGWWFFAFKIDEIQYYPYPFFVRGDDVLFSIINKFNVFTVSGIASWAEDFYIKENPLTRYLGCRGTLVCAILTDNISWKEFARQYAHWFLVNIFSYNYASAEAVLMAVEDIMNGPDIFLDDMTAEKVREKIAPLSAQEKLQPMRREYINPVFVSFEEKPWRKLWRLLTWNGFLLPSFMLKDGPVFQPKHFRATFRQIFRYKQVFYEYEAGHIGYVAKHDKKRFFVLLWRFGKSLCRYSLRYRAIRQEYRQRMAEMTSLGFWRSVYSDTRQQSAVLHKDDIGEEL